ncbi:MAG TPA: phosphate acyltransferase, partial [Hyphomicrobiaceae bacterium]|nr:phosphate acyltransferase [Hyphomicrobiaceae bacterium]
AFTLLRAVTKSIAIGPILLGAAKPVHIVTSSATVRSLLNMSAVAVGDTGRFEGNEPGLAANREPMR